MNVKDLLNLNIPLNPQHNPRYFTSTGMLRLRWWPLMGLGIYAVPLIFCNLLILGSVMSGDYGRGVEYWWPLHWPLKLLLGWGG